MNVTLPTTITLQAIAAGHAYGFDIMSATGLPSGTVYPLLRRLERLGCVTADWEAESTATREGRPRRRHYRITPAGRKHLVLAHERFGQQRLRLSAT